MSAVFNFAGALLRRAVQNPVEKQIITGARAIAGGGGGIESGSQQPVVMVVGGLAQQLACNQIGEIYPAAYFSVEPLIVGRINGSIAIAINACVQNRCRCLTPPPPL